MPLENMATAFTKNMLTLMRKGSRLQGINPLPLIHSSSREMSTQENTKPKADKKMSMAMKFYLERKREHDAFIARERSSFEMGKSHLANMMGMDAATMTQEDIDKAIEYLFPSGLIDEKARPVMKPPEEIFPKQKEAEFDIDGRPKHPFFYCVIPTFFQTIYEAVEHHENLTFFADRMMRQNKRPDPDQVLSEKNLATTRWMNKEELEVLLCERIRDSHYAEFVTTFERLVSHPFSYRAKDFIFKFRVEVGTLQSKDEVVLPQFDEQGRAFVEAYGQRCSANALVRVTKPGSGRVTITHADYPDHPKDIQYFYSIKERHLVMYPLQFTGLLGLVDIDCTVDAGGARGQAGAIRFALASALRSFVDEEMAEQMTVCGLLTQDVRVPERKKPGQMKARRKYTWKKR